MRELRGIRWTAPATPPGGQDQGPSVTSFGRSPPRSAWRAYKGRPAAKPAPQPAVKAAPPKPSPAPEAPEESPKQHPVPPEPVEEAAPTPPK